MTLEELRELAKHELDMGASTNRLAATIGMPPKLYPSDVLARAVLAMADVVEVEAELHPPEARHNKSCGVCQAMAAFDGALVAMGDSHAR